jgi:hypothetical protein
MDVISTGGKAGAESWAVCRVADLVRGRGLSWAGSKQGVAIGVAGAGRNR